jgi:hypothetical protein
MEYKPISGSYLWNDLSCSRVIRFICEEEKQACGNYFQICINYKEKMLVKLKSHVFTDADFDNGFTFEDSYYEISTSLV